MPRVEFTGQAARDDDHGQGNTSRLINLYREPMGGMAQHVLKAVPGTEDFATMGGDTPMLFVRDIKEVAGVMYVMAGGTLYSVTSTGAQTALVETVSKAGARIFGAESGKVCTVTDGRYFVWDGSTSTEPTGGNFSSFGGGLFLGNYVVLTELNGRRFLWSDLADAGTLPGLNFATADSTDDNIVRPIALNGRLWLMKESVTEIWAPSGLAGANALQHIPGGVIPTGLKAAGLVAEFDGGFMFIGSDDIAYMTLGGALQPVSTPAVNTAIAASSPTDCYAYEDEGHKFCVIRFSDRPAWCFDIATGEWHERAQGREDPWPVTVTGKAYGRWFAGDVFGNVKEFSRTYKDGSESLIRTAVSNTIYADGKRFRGKLIEFTGSMGLGETAATEEVWRFYYPDGREFYIGEDNMVLPDDAIWRVEHLPVREPSAFIRFSNDGGKTFGSEVSRDMGSVGEFDQRMIVRNFGQYRRLTVEVSISAPRALFLDNAANVELA